MCFCPEGELQVTEQWIERSLPVTGSAGVLECPCVLLSPHTALADRTVDRAACASVAGSSVAEDRPLRLRFFPR